MASFEDKLEAVRNSKAFDKELNYLEDTVADELKQASKLLASSSVKACSNSAVSAFKNQTSVVDKAMDKAQDEFTDLIHGTPKSFKPFDSAIVKVIDEVDHLMKANVAFQAVNDAALDVKLGAFFVAFSPTTKVAARLRSMETELKKIIADLKKAQGKVKGATAKTVIKGTITVASMCAGPLGLGARIGVTVGSNAVSAVLDSATGSGSSSELQGYVSTANDIVSTGNGFQNKLGAATGAFTAFLGTALDANETREAIALKKAIDKRLAAFVKEIAVARKEFAALVKDLSKLTGEALKAYDKAVREANKFSSQKGKLSKVRNFY